MLHKGGWNESATQGAGKFIFDLGVESHGEYLPIEKGQDLNLDYYVIVLT